MFQYPSTVGIYTVWHSVIHQLGSSAEQRNDSAYNNFVMIMQLFDGLSGYNLVNAVE
jgi:hypothetical protein